ncbi:hypothetical protein INT43_008692 [Umbelopsis isabellina]|uniref:Ataxin-10 homolog n=1 Tax=Mortierella isabellina TaxID=91625 RepID=A0A8H7PWP1_MORIS|nr:hypothetical protein INT43_008692 [Umbelopsis isabellina]
MTSILSVTLELQQQLLENVSTAPLPLYIECLENCAKQVIGDAGLREELGGRKAFWQQSCQCIDSLRDELAQDQDDETVRQTLIATVRLVRNIVANDINNQANAVSSGISNNIENMLAWCLLENIPESKHIRAGHNTFLNYCVEYYTLPTDRPITQMGVQALCNMLTGNSKQQNILWTVWMKDSGYSALFAKLLSTSDQITLMSTLVLIFNCIRNDRERSSMLVETQTGKMILKCLLKNAELVLEDEKTQNFELIFAIFEQVVNNGLFSKAFASFASKEGLAISSNQTILLKMYDSAIHRQQSHINLNAADERLLVDSLKTTCNQAVDALSKLPEVASSALGSSDSNAEASSMTESGGSAEDQRNVRMTVEDTANAYTGVILLLQTIGTMIVEGQCSSEVKQEIANGGCLKACLDLLAQAERKIPRITKSTEAMVSDTDTSKGTVGFMYIKRDIVRLVGALAYQDRQMQDKVRELGGIGLVLSQCNIDDANPCKWFHPLASELFLVWYVITECIIVDVKEYAIVAVRNLLDKNSENQAIVEQLSPQDAVPHPVLEEIGVTTELRDGKVNVRKP